MGLIETVADRIPERTRPAVMQLAHLVSPRMSWRKRRRVGTTRRAVIDRFFDSEAEFESLETEFFEGRVVGICRSAMERVPDDVSIYDAHMDECVLLYALVRKYRPQTVVETGVYHGVATTSLLLALDENDAGRLYSLDASPLLDDGTAGGGVEDGAPDPHRSGDRTFPPGRAEYYRRGRPSCAEAGTHRLPPGRNPGWIVPADLRDRWELSVGRSQTTLPDLLSEVGSVDVFVHDSEHSTTGMCFEFDLAWESLVPEGVLVSLHVGRNDAFETFTAERRCHHGRLTYTYNGFEDYAEPCSTGYAIKPDGVAGTGRTPK